MTSNLGSVDRSMRIVWGLILFALAFTDVLSGGFATAAYIVGGLALVTGVFRHCPVWSLFGIDTCPLKSGQSK